MAMKYYPKTALGFEINEELAEMMGLVSEYKHYVENRDNYPFYKAFCAKFEVPDSFGVELRTFKDERGGYTQGLEGFEYGRPYVYFSGVDPACEDLQPILSRLKEAYADEGLFLERAAWSELM